MNHVHPEQGVRCDTNDGFGPRPLLHLVLHTARSLEAMLRTELSPRGLHHGQGRVLDLLWHQLGGLTQVEIALRLGIRETASTQVVRRLEALRLVRRRADDEDARAVCVTLTPAGREAARQVREAWARAEHRLIANMTEQGVEDARRMLLRLRDALGKSTMDGPGTHEDENGSDLA
jgi:DNA-binding MarR family transcriptional regulator